MKRYPKKLTVEVGIYRTRPDVVQAVHFDGSEASAEVILQWTKGLNRVRSFENSLDHTWVIDIHTSKGTIHAGPGDWIVKRNMVDFTVVKDSVFKDTYELMADGVHTEDIHDQN